MKSFIVVFITIGLIFLALSYVPGTNHLTSYIFDRTPPESTVSDLNDGNLIINLTDTKSGLGEITVNAIQGEINKELYHEKFPDRTNTRTITLPVSLTGLGLREGDIELLITVEDRAFFANKSSQTKTILLDFESPRLELLTLQHIAHQGGAELIIYRAVDSNLQDSGITVGKTLYPGFPFSYLKSDSKDESLFASLIALPFEFDPKNAKITLFAKDKAGNKVSQELSFQIGPFTQLSVEPKLSQNFLEQKVPSLYKKYLLTSSMASNINLSNDDGLLSAFKLVNEEYRTNLDQELEKLLTANVTPRAGSGIFIKPMKSATSSNLGEKRTYLYEGKPISQSLHNGLDLASVQNDKVHAAQAGQVILAKDFGIYGNAVVIDHGIGITTLYGHLASLFVKVGDSVKKGDPIGTSGQTGLAGGDHLHFEVRVQATPVNPIEWWDPNWIKDNIDGKIEGISFN